MRRPRPGLVSRTREAPSQPSAGITTGCPRAGLHVCDDERAVATAPDKGRHGLSPTGSTAPRGQKTPQVERREAPSSDRKEEGDAFARCLGRLRQPLRGSRKPPRLPALRSPRGSRELHFGLRRTRRRSKNTGDHPCPHKPMPSSLEVRYARSSGRRHATFLPHSLLEAMSAPSRNERSFSHTAGSITHSRLVKVPKPQSVEAMTRSRSPTARTASSIRRATTSGCSTKFDVVSITPGTRIMSFGSGAVLNAAYSCAWRGLENSIDSAPTLA